MSGSAWLMLAMLLVMIALLVSDRLPAWLVLVGVLTVAMTLNLATPAALLKGFSNQGVITVAALFPVAAGLYATGAVSLLAQRFIGLPRTVEAAQLKILPPVALVSALLYNTPLVAMAIPVVRDVARVTGLPSRKLYMGLSFVSILGGSMTLIGTSVNLIVAGLVTDAIGAGGTTVMRPLEIFDPLWVGLPASIAGVAYMILVGGRLLPERANERDAVPRRRIYRGELAVEPGTPLDGMTLADAGFSQPVGYTLDSITRNGVRLEPAPDLALAGGDVLGVEAPADILSSLWTTVGLVPAHTTGMRTSRHEHQLVELVVSRQSPAVGHKVSELPLPGSPFEMMLVGVSRDGATPTGSLGAIRVEPGDAAIVEVDNAFYYEARRETDFILTHRLRGFRVQRVDRAVAAGVITLCMIAAAAFGVMSMLNAALLATGAMLVTGSLTVERLWESVDWRVFVTLGAAVGLESAVTGSGLAQAVAHALAAAGVRSPMTALVLVYVGTVVLSNVISNAAAVALMFPVAWSLATDMGVSFLPFAIALISAAACAFLNPVVIQTNLLVRTPGEYTFTDFVRVGLPLTLIVGVVVLALTPLAYGF